MLPGSNALALVRPVRLARRALEKGFGVRMGFGRPCSLGPCQLSDLHIREVCKLAEHFIISSLFCTPRALPSTSVRTRRRSRAGGQGFRRAAWGFQGVRRVGRGRSGRVQTPTGSPAPCGQPTSPARSPVAFWYLLRSYLSDAPFNQCIAPLFTKGPVYSLFLFLDLLAGLY